MAADSSRNTDAKSAATAPKKGTDAPSGPNRAETSGTAPGKNGNRTAGTANAEAAPASGKGQDAEKAALAPPEAPGLQDFTVVAQAEQAAARLTRLRAEMEEEGFDAYLVPRADAHQGEYVAPRDERLSWLTGFTGSAGLAIVLADRAAVFSDGRYRLQLRAQLDAALFDCLDAAGTPPADYLAEHLSEGDLVAYDPWLHTVDEIEKLRDKLETRGIELVETLNLIDRVWDDQPPAPVAPMRAWPDRLAGSSHAEKRAAVAEALRSAGQHAAVLTLPDSIAWLLNVRGTDIPHTPIAQANAILYDSGRVELFIAPQKAAPVADHLGADVKVVTADDFPWALRQLAPPVRIDPATAPEEVRRILDEAAIEIARERDPCVLPKARKTAAEIAATTEAHQRDGVAVCRFLHWLDERITALEAGRTLTEIDVVRALEGFRHATGCLKDISFDTIAGSGPNGAIVHYRVTEATNREMHRGELLLVDSGAQYEDGTTDITRTVALGQPSAEQRACFTRVLKGMIALSRARFPRGLAGRDLDALARAALWRHGQDYDHGTGHGVGVYLSVHEGPQRISRASEVPLEPGMILSNEPGFYHEGQYGIRIENLIAVAEPPRAERGDDRDMLGFDTLTLAPIDRRLINAGLLSDGERDWLNGYHAEVWKRIGPELDAAAQDWLKLGTSPL